MSAERTRKVLYLDSSAIVKLVIEEPESASLRRAIRRRKPLATSALARTEVVRAVAPDGPSVVERARRLLGQMDLIRLSDRLLNTAGELEPADLRSLDAIHLATARDLGRDLAAIVTYDDRLRAAAREAGLRTMAPR